MRYCCCTIAYLAQVWFEWCPLFHFPSTSEREFGMEVNLHCATGLFSWQLWLSITLLRHEDSGPGAQIDLPGGLWVSPPCQGQKRRHHSKFQLYIQPTWKDGIQRCLSWLICSYTHHLSPFPWPMLIAWQVDGFDVRSAMNPCSGIEPGKIYVGSEPDELGRPEASGENSSACFGWFRVHSSTNVGVFSPTALEVAGRSRGWSDRCVIEICLFGSFLYVWLFL